MNQTPRFGIGILGTGIMGRRMATALAAHPRFDVIAIWDPSPAALDAAQPLCPIARRATGIADLVADPAVDLVYVASPPAHHLNAVQAALAASRAVLCEKPLAADTTQAGALRDAADAASRPTAVHFPFARSAASRRLIELVHGGELGDVVDARITLRFAQWPRPWQAAASDWLAGPDEGGFTREVLSHFVFLAQRLFGPAEVADVLLSREPGQTETALRAQLVHRQGKVSIDAAVAGDIADSNRFEVHGSRSSAALVDWARLDYGGQISERSESMPATLDALAAMLEGRTDHGLASFSEAASVVHNIEAMLQG
ncbi:Gfo/Idh/MocA family protein [Piscinibacter sakaiensis]|uniref:Gfo/Idh/MocA family protein n=1 Tax=Piscinibacter sakaiensis TaxID=1547922 RepID=UPI003AB02457